MNNGQIFFPFRKDQNYGIAWKNMLLVFHELPLQGGAEVMPQSLYKELHSLFIKSSLIFPSCYFAPPSLDF